MIVLRTPKGWTGPKGVDGHKVEGFWRAHQVPLSGIHDNAEHLAAMEAHGIGAIDLVVVNLYPFEAALERGADYAEMIEKGLPEKIEPIATARIGA